MAASTESPFPSRAAPTPGLDSVLRKRRFVQRAAPFPHAAFDEFIPQALVARVAKEVPEWIDCDSSQPAKAGAHCYMQPALRYREARITSERHMGPATRQLFALLRSPEWVRFLQRLTGIDEPLYPDPGYEGSGLHLSAPGGLLQVHADAGHLGMSPRWHRRVQTFVDLTHDWREEYGGDLELWDRNATRCEARIAPAFGRYVVFHSDDFSFHGSPAPLKAPPRRMRRSLALHYYTRGERPANECIEGRCDAIHAAIFKPAGGDGQPHCAATPAPAAPTSRREQARRRAAARGGDGGGTGVGRERCAGRRRGELRAALLRPREAVRAGRCRGAAAPAGGQPGLRRVRHTYNVKETSNPRNNEHSVPLNVSEIFLMTDRVVMDTDADFLRAERELARQYFPRKSTGGRPSAAGSTRRRWTT